MSAAAKPAPATPAMLPPATLYFECCGVRVPVLSLLGGRATGKCRKCGWFARWTWR